MTFTQNYLHPRKNIVWGSCNGFVRDIKMRLDTKSLYDILIKSD